MRIVRDTFVADLALTRHMIRQFGPGHRGGTVVIRDQEDIDHRVKVSLRPDGRMVVSAVGWINNQREVQRCLLVQEGTGRDHALALRARDGQVVPDVAIPIGLLIYLADPLTVDTQLGMITAGDPLQR